MLCKSDKPSIIIIIIGLLGCYLGTYGIITCSRQGVQAGGIPECRQYGAG